MYAIIALFILIGVWMIFITRVLIKINSDNEMKRTTQEYFKKKVDEIKKEIDDGKI